jgi:hypothetical protein
MTDKELAQALTEALDERIARAEAAAAPRPAVVRLPLPEKEALPVIRAVPVRQTRWKAAVAALLALVMLGGAGLAAFKLMDRTEPTTPGNTEPSPSEVQTTEPTEPVEPPQVEYDAETKTIHITGTSGYDQADLTPYMQEAQYLEVEDDEFGFSLSISGIIATTDWSRTYLSDFLPFYLFKLDRTTAFTKQYFAQHAPNEAVAAQARKPVNYSYKTVWATRWENSPEQIDVIMGAYFQYMYDTAYMLAMIDPENESWQHQGFAEWFALVNPYNCNYGETAAVSPDYDYYYYADYFRVGGSGDLCDLKEKFLLYDACSWYNLIHGMNWDGNEYETQRITRSDRAKVDSEIEGNDVSIYMAISLINYLVEQYGEEPVIAYCFDTCSFEEAFGVSYAAARAAWEQSLLDRFGDGSETP